jgi:hypothetical protein
VTVCVATMCAENILLGASDRMLTAGDVEFEPETAKLYPVTNSCVVMIAGESSLQMSIVQRVNLFTVERVKAKPTEWMSIREIADYYHSAYQAIKSEKAAARALGPLGLTMNEFLNRQRDMQPDIVSQLTSAILNFEMPAIEAIIAGIDPTGAHIFVVNNAEVACRDAIGFAAIGIGYWHANSQFMFAGHNRSRPLPETLLLTYAAKRRAEVAPGVGAGTDMFTMGPNLGTYTVINENIVNDLGKIYKKTRSRAAKSVRSSNAEVNKYVENLGKESTAQQSSPTPEQSKADGADKGGEDGKADPGAAAKPN